MRSISATGDFQFQDGFGDNFSTSFASLYLVSEALFGDDSRTPDIASFCPRARRASQSKAKRWCQEMCLASLEALQAYPSRCVGCVSFVLLIVSPHYEQDKINTTQVTTVWLRL